MLEISSTVAIIIGGTAVLGNIGTGIGLAVTWNRNGRNAAAKYGKLEGEVSNVGAAVTSLTQVVKEADDKREKDQLHTVAAISAYQARLNGHDKDIEDINKTMERRST